MMYLYFSIVSLLSILLLLKKEKRKKYNFFIHCKPGIMKGHCTSSIDVFYYPKSIQIVTPAPNFSLYGCLNIYAICKAKLVFHSSEPLWKVYLLLYTELGSQ